MLIHVVLIISKLPSFKLIIDATIMYNFGYHIPYHGFLFSKKNYTQMTYSLDKNCLNNNLLPCGR